MWLDGNIMPFSHLSVTFQSHFSWLNDKGLSCACKLKFVHSQEFDFVFFCNSTGILLDTHAVYTFLDTSHLARSHFLDVFHSSGCYFYPWKNITVKDHQTGSVRKYTYYGSPFASVKGMDVMTQLRLNWI